jgi:hypothetical protein
MKPLTVVDDDTLPLRRQSTITLRHALGFGAASELASEWQQLQRDLGGPPADMHAAYLLLTHYIIDWSGPAFADVGPYSLHALSQVKPTLTIMQAAMTAVIKHHARVLPPIEQPTAPPADDPEYEAMVDRYRRKLRASDGRTVVAGRHDALVSLIWALKMTQRQIEDEFEPEVLGELLARLDAEARNYADEKAGKKPKGPRPAVPMTREQKIAQMAEWGRQSQAPEAA